MSGSSNDGAAAACVFAFCGDYTRYGNAARLFEDFVYSHIGGKAKDFNYLLTTLTWSGMGIAASLAGDVLSSRLSPWRKTRVLALAGAASFAAGYALSFAVPPIRYIYTASFTLETLGLSALLLAVAKVAILTWLLCVWRRARNSGGCAK